MNDAIDRPIEVREGEALDVARLGPFLEIMLGFGGEEQVLQYPSGFSNLTYMLKVGETEPALEQA